MSNWIPSVTVAVTLIFFNSPHAIGHTRGLKLQLLPQDHYKALQSIQPSTPLQIWTENLFLSKRNISLKITQSRLLGKAAGFAIQSLDLSDVLHNPLTTDVTAIEMKIRF